jgi:probable addiction module antidote protein
MTHQIENATKVFDASEYLDDAESQAELLSEALATGNAGVIAHAIGTIARAKGMSEIARETGLNRSGLYAALADDSNPELDTILKVLAALNLQLQAKPKESALAN